MRKFGVITVACAMATFTAPGAMAATFTTSFVTEAAIDESSSKFDTETTGFFYKAGHRATETISGTGLAQITGLDLVLDVAYSSLTGPLGFGLSIDGTTVGLFDVGPISAGNQVSASFSGFSVAGDGDYEISLFVYAPVGGGNGSITFSTVYEDGLMLTDEVSAEEGLIDDEGPEKKPEEIVEDVVGAAPLPTPVPLPAGLPLLMAGVGGMAAFRLRSKKG